MGDEMIEEAWKRHWAATSRCADDAPTSAHDIERSGFYTGFRALRSYCLTDEAVERGARVIAPGSWSVFDGYLADMLRKYKGENAGYDPEAFKDKISMAEARACLIAVIGDGE